MTRDEFRALQKGDRICNPMTGSKGEVRNTYDTRAGHHIEIIWDGSRIVVGSIGENSTVWMHWTREEKGETEASPK